MIIMGKYIRQIWVNHNILLLLSVGFVRSFCYAVMFCFYYFDVCQYSISAASREILCPRLWKQDCTAILLGIENGLILHNVCLGRRGLRYLQSDDESACNTRGDHRLTRGFCFRILYRGSHKSSGLF